MRCHACDGRTDGRTHGKWKVGQYSVWAESAKRTQIYTNLAFMKSLHWRLPSMEVMIEPVDSEEQGQCWSAGRRQQWSRRGQMFWSGEESPRFFVRCPEGARDIVQTYIFGVCIANIIFPMVTLMNECCHQTHQQDKRSVSKLKRVQNIFDTWIIRALFQIMLSMLLLLTSKSKS